MNLVLRAKLDANRKKALERLKQRGILKDHQLKQIEKRNTHLGTVITAQAKPDAHYNEASFSLNAKVTSYTKTPISQVRDAQTHQSSITPASIDFLPALTTENRPLNRISPTIRTKDYIEYDFSTIKNMNGGYINPQDRTSGYDIDDYGGDGNPMYGSKQQKSLDDWKREQQERRHIYENAPPPEHMASAPKCIECNINIEMDPILHDVFKLQVCKSCSKNHPEKYALLTKTECKQDYFLTDPELNDDQLFHRLEKPNPHSGTFARMQLFVRSEIEQFSFKKWGSEEGLDEEWQRREEGKTQRREKKYQQKIKEMRLKTRAQEYTNRLIEKKHGKAHVHEFSNPIDGGEDEDGHSVLKRRCTECGLEIEEVSI